MLLALHQIAEDLRWALIWFLLAYALFLTLWLRNDLPGEFLYCNPETNCAYCSFWCSNEAIDETFMFDSRREIAND